MDVIRKTVDTVMKRPALFIYTGIIVAILLVLNIYNPVLPILLGITSITRSSIFESIVAGLQVISDPGFLPLIALAVAGGVVISALAASLVLSGFLFTLNRTLDGIPVGKGGFTSGLKKYFKRIFFVNIRSILLTVVFTVFIMVASVPAIVITRSSATERPELLLAALLIDFLTAAVLLMGTIFFASYMLFWYPAIFTNVKKAFVLGKKAVDKGFWKIAGRLVCFGFVFVIFQYLIFLIPVQFLKSLVLWIFWTVFSITLAVYVFSAFKEYSAAE